MTCPQESLYQVWDNNSQNWSSASNLKLWEKSVKIQHQCEWISNIPSRDWRAWKNWFFMLTIFLAPAIFSIHDIWKKIKKMVGNKNFFASKNQFFHACQPHEGIFDIWSHLHCVFAISYQRFKQLPVIQFWELMSKNEIWRTISCIYFMKIWVRVCFVTSGSSLIRMLE